MGREIRRVPKGWQHPKTVNRYSSKEEYQPMYDEDFETAAREWLDNQTRYEAIKSKYCAAAMNARAQLFP